MPPPAPIDFVPVIEVQTIPNCIGAEVALGVHASLAPLAPKSHSHTFCFWVTKILVEITSTSSTNLLQIVQIVEGTVDSGVTAFFACWYWFISRLLSYNLPSFHSSLLCCPDFCSLLWSGIVSIQLYQLVVMPKPLSRTKHRHNRLPLQKWLGKF